MAQGALTILPPAMEDDPAEDTAPISREEISQRMFEEECQKANGDLEKLRIAREQLYELVGPVSGEQIVVRSQAERLLRNIVEFLSMRFQGSNRVERIKSDIRFASAKKNYLSIVQDRRQALAFIEGLFNS